MTCKYDLLFFSLEVRQSLVSKAHLLSGLIDLDRDGQVFVFVDNWEVIINNIITKWGFSLITGG